MAPDVHFFFSNGCAVNAKVAEIKKISIFREKADGGVVVGNGTLYS